MKKAPVNSKPSLTIIGAGRLGTALAVALNQLGYRIETIVSRRLSKARKSAALLDAAVKVLAAKEIAQLKLSDLTIIATPDDQIAAVAHELAELEGAGTVFHTSGALSSSVLGELASQGWQTGSIHPLTSVSDALSGATQFRGAHWCVEGSRQAVRAGKSLIKDLGGLSFSIKSSSKPLYHAAAVMTSGNVVALFAVALDMMKQSGLKRTEAQRILLPLLDSTLASLKRHDPAGALTGTFSRGDLSTVQRHLEALSGDGLDVALKLYRLLGLRSLELSSLDRETVKRITDELRREERGRRGDGGTGRHGDTVT
jgi:predicted short-subunit dehydrogenase-like oxidoreductase (DUF2520 family)